MSLQFDDGKQQESNHVVGFLFRYERALQESTDDLEIRHADCCAEEKWYQHPTKLIKVNHKGDHLFDMKAGRFCPITVITYKLRNEKSKVPFIRVLVWCCDQTYTFYRLALECFLNQELTSQEHVDHKDRDRKNNCFENLRAVSLLESANNKSTTEKYRADGSLVSVYHKEKKNHWLVQYSDYEKWEQIGRSCIIKVCFWYKKNGDGSDRAEKAANELREAKLEEMEQYRGAKSMEQRGRLPDGTPIVPIDDNSKACKKRTLRKSPGLDSETVSKRKEKNALNIQRRRLNKARKKNGQDPLMGPYTPEECAGLPNSRYHQEEYLVRTAPPKDKNNVVEKYHRLLQKFQTFVAVVPHQEEQSPTFTSVKDADAEVKCHKLSESFNDEEEAEIVNTEDATGLQPSGGVRAVSISPRDEEKRTAKQQVEAGT